MDVAASPSHEDVLKVLFRMIQAYSAVSALSHLSTAQMEALLQIFEPKWNKTTELLESFGWKPEPPLAPLIPKAMESAVMSVQLSINAARLVF